MKVKVLKSFSDAKKKCLYEVNQIIEVTKKRYEEMNSTSSGLLVEEIQDSKTDNSKEE